MTRYLITLTPVGLFFFGGEQTFGDGENENYFARSNPFPQQTTLLGMLRKEVLIQSGIYKENVKDYTDDAKKKMDGLIGKESFIIDAGPDKKQDFGVIKSLSPLFVANGKTSYIPCPKDHGMALSPKPGRAYLDRKVDFIPFINGYKAKKGLPSGFISSDLRESIPFDKVMKEHIKIGIDKERPTGTDEDDDDKKFFKHQFYRMEKDFSFAFFAEIDMELKDATVFMGADSSSFFMKVEKAGGRSFEKLFAKKPDTGKITLLSDALADPAIYEVCDFAITETLDFKNITTSTGKYTYRKDESKSGKFALLKRGSVLFVQDETGRNAVKSQLNNAHLKMIGYNYHI